MKKILKLLFAVALTSAVCVAFVACGGDSGPTPPEPPKPPELPQNPDPPEVAEVLELTGLSDAYYYHYYLNPPGNENPVKIPLEKVEGKYHVMFHSENEARLKDELEKAGAKISNIINGSDYPDYDVEYPGAHKTATVEGDYEKIGEALSLTFYCGSYYFNDYTGDNDNEAQRASLWAGWSFSVLVKSEADCSLLDNMVEEYGMKIVLKTKVLSEVAGYVDGYLLACPNGSKGNSVELANFFYETGLFAQVSDSIEARGSVEI